MGDVVPATIAVPFTATVTNCVIDSTNAATLGSGAPTVTFAITTPAESFDATGVACSSDTSLAGTTPGTFTNTTDQVATVTIVDVYGQTGTASANITVTAPPTLTEFQATFNPTYGPFTDRDIFPSTVASTFALTGTNLRSGADVEFFEDSSLATSLGAQGATSSGSNTEVTGTTPTISPALTAHLTDVSVVLTNTDGQSNQTPLSGIKAVAPPEITSVANKDSGLMAMFVANGPERSLYDGSAGQALTFEITGTNLDSSSPNPLYTSRPGAAFLSLGGGAVAIDGTRGTGPYPDADDATGGDDQGRIASDTAVEFELQDNGNTDTYGSELLADVFGYLDVISLTDYTGQVTSAGIEDAMLTARGFANVGEGHAVALATGNLDGSAAKFPGDEGADLVVLTSSGLYGSHVDVFYGTYGEALPIDPDETSDIPSFGDDGLTTYGSRNMLITDFNGDGYGDLFVGIPDYNFIDNYAGDGEAGAVFVWYGTASGIDAGSDGPDITILGEDAIDYGPHTGTEGFGAALATGDFNGDTLPDLAVGAPGQYGKDGTKTSSGVVHLYLGNVDGITSAAADLVFEVTGTPASGDRSDNFGLGIAMGDVDGDGDDDLFAGAPGFNGLAGDDLGRVWMFEADSNLDAASDRTFTGASTGATLAYPSIADVNGDAYADLLIGAPAFGVGGGELRLYIGQVDAVTGVFVVTPPSGGDPAGDGSLVMSASPTHYTLGTCAGTKPISWADGIVVSAANLAGPTLVNGRVERFLAQSITKAFTYDFVSVETLDRPEDLLPHADEQYGAYVEAANVIDTDESGPDIFINIPSVSDGDRSGFLVVYPSAKTPVK